jgi:thymidylate synthase
MNMQTNACDKIIDDVSLKSCEEFRRIYHDLKTAGKLVKPRGQLVLEIENYSYSLSPFVRFQNFSSRKMNLQYIKDEFLWYLKGDKFDTSIAEKAKMWKNLVNDDGSINSNYGFYIFTNKQFDNVIKTLSSDKDSRRASMVILNDGHLLSTTPDVPCTYAISFRVRDDALNMSVRMRSQDAIYGMTNDAPAFSFIHEMVFNALRAVYPMLRLGVYHHTADSFHVYERHFDMFEKLATDDEYVPIDCPRIAGPDEVSFLRKLDFSSIPEHFAFSRWLLTW